MPDIREKQRTIATILRREAQIFFGGETAYVAATSSPDKVKGIRHLLKGLGLQVDHLPETDLLELERFLAVFSEPKILVPALVANSKARELFLWLAERTGEISPKTITASDVGLSVEMRPDTHQVAGIEASKVNGNMVVSTAYPEVVMHPDLEFRVEHWLKLERWGNELTEQQLGRLYRKLKDIFVDRGGRGNRVRVEWDIELIAKNGRTHNLGERIFVCSRRVPLEVFNYYFQRALETGALYDINSRIELIEMLVAAEGIERVAVIPGRISRPEEKQAYVEQYDPDLAEALIDDIVRGVPQLLYSI